jgi:hypothetical protein
VEGAADVTTKAFEALLQQQLGPVCVLLVVAIAGQFFLARKDIAAKDKEIASITKERLADAKVWAETSNEAVIKLHDALDLVSRLEPIRPRRGG